MSNQLDHEDLDVLEARLAHPSRFYPPTVAEIQAVITELRAARERVSEDTWEEERADARDVLQRLRFGLPSRTNPTRNDEEDAPEEAPDA